MSASSRAAKLNTRAVEKLNGVMISARLGQAPDVKEIVADVLSGKPVAALKEGFGWSNMLGFVVLVGILGAIALSEKLAAVLFILWFLVSVVLPPVVRFLSDVSNPFSSRGPSCDVSGCGSSADYSLDPTGLHRINLCYSHKGRLERRFQYACLFRPESAKSIVGAYQDLVKAAKLDPSSCAVRENLQQARELAQIVLERDVK